MRHALASAVLIGSFLCLAACSGTPVDVGTGGGAGGGSTSGKGGGTTAGTGGGSTSSAGGGTATATGGGDGTTDAGGTANDDGGTSDGGAGADAGLSDGGGSSTPDDGGLDAGSEGGDAGVGDGGSASDAGGSDAGLGDAGTGDAGPAPTDCVGTTHVLFEQLPHGPQGQFTYSNPEDGGYARWADDFTVPAGDGCWCVESITADGFPSMITPPPAGTLWRLAFYENAKDFGSNNVPGTPTVSMDLTPTTLGDAKADFTLPTVLKLSPGLRWLSVAARTKTTVVQGTISGPVWAWFNSANPHTAGGNAAAFIDSGGLLPGSEGVWNSGSNLPLKEDLDLSFKLHGRTATKCQ